MEDLKIPNHVAMILDGNRRYAVEHHKPKMWGHKKGFEHCIELAKYIFKRGVSYLSIYCFSTENFKRSEEEVSYLMDIFTDCFHTRMKELDKENIKIVFSGRKEPLRSDVLEAMNEIALMTQNNTGGILNVCINYGGHAEITDMTKKIGQLLLDKELKLEDITEEVVTKNLYQDLPPVDLMIRTGGDLRISNFLLWQNAYAEFYFPKCYFPAFSENEFEDAIYAYNGRERRFGGDSKCKKE